MASFSKQYLELSNLIKWTPEFDYLEEFEQLAEGETSHENCEGLGVYGITRKDNEPHLIIKDIGSGYKLISYQLFIESYSRSLDNN